MCEDRSSYLIGRTDEEKGRVIGLALVQYRKRPAQRMLARRITFAKTAGSHMPRLHLKFASFTHN